jgi:hypothetical protein
MLFAPKAGMDCDCRSAGAIVEGIGEDADESINTLHRSGCVELLGRFPGGARDWNFDGTEDEGAHAWADYGGA